MNFSRYLKFLETLTHTFIKLWITLFLPSLECLFHIYVGLMRVWGKILLLLQAKLVNIKMFYIVSTKLLACWLYPYNQYTPVTGLLIIELHIMSIFPKSVWGGGEGGGGDDISTRGIRLQTNPKPQELDRVPVFPRECVSCVFDAINWLLTHWQFVCAFFMTHTKTAVRTKLHLLYVPRSEDFNLSRW